MTTEQRFETWIDGAFYDAEFFKHWNRDEMFMAWKDSYEETKKKCVEVAVKYLLDNECVKPEALVGVKKAMEAI